jgi:quaternary ammonium compound-resistance protein SugE
MNWFALIIAGLLEVAWAFTMKQSLGFTKLIPSIATIVLMLMSFALLAFAMKSLPLGTSYAVWTGIGTLGAFMVGILFLGEEVNLIRISAAVLILAGLALMKISSPS